MRITLLGTGTPAPSLTRQSSGYLVDVAGSVLVFDHGPGAHHRLLEAGRSSTSVTHAFFSHLHYDHCLDYPRLVLQRWDMGADRIPDLEVFGPSPLARMTELLFGDGGVYDADIRARLEHQSSRDVFAARGGALPRRRPAPRVTEIAAGSRIDGPEWTVTAGAAAHVQPYLDCLAFRLDSAEGAVCYSGDSGPCDALIELARGCDVLIHMNHHFSGTEPSPAYRAACGSHRDNAAAAQAAGVGTLVLTHILPQIDRAGVRERIVQEIAQVYDGRVIWGEDLMEIEVARDEVGPIEPRS
jgi:ribonuclease BN (tRNA processing enzyme)